MRPDEPDRLDDSLDELARSLPEAEPGPDAAGARRDVLFAIARSRRRRVLAWRVGSVAAFALAGIVASLTLARLRSDAEPAPIAMAPNGGVTRITQSSGQVTYDVAPRRPGERFVVETPQADIEVRGTRFSVAVENGETSVDVDHGRVEVREPGTRKIGAVLGRGGHTTLRRPPPAPLVGSAPLALAAPPPAPALPAPEPSAASIPGPAPGPVIPTAPGGTPHAAPQGRSARAPAPEEPASAAPPEPPPEPVPASGRRPDDGELRLFRAAHELHFQRGDIEAALRAWNRYLSAYPHGALAEEARYNRAVCLLRLGRDHEADRDLSRLAEDPTAFRAREARLLRAATLRREGRCEEAERLLAPLRRGDDEIARRAADLPPCR